MGESATSHNLLAAVIVVIKAIRLSVNTLTITKGKKIMSKTESIYWMVHRSSQKEMYPTLLHTSRNDAIADASRRALLNVGVVFNVLVVDSSFCYTPLDLSPVVPVQLVRE